MLDINQVNGVTVIALEESYDALDPEKLGALDEALLGEAAVVDTPRMVIDMSKTTYINSSFIETAFRTWKRVQQKGGEMAFCCLNPFCKEVLEVTRLDQIWTLCDTREAAIQAVSGKA